MDEIAFAFGVRALDHNDDNLIHGDFDRLITGLMNNLPDLAPLGIASRHGKRQALRRMGLRLAPGLTLDQVPIVNIDTRLHRHIDRYARKIALALYYREQRRIAKAGHRVLATWGQASDPSFINRSQGFYNMTPISTIGIRPNVDIGDQFRYQCNKADNPDVFAALAEFGSGGIVLQMIVVSENAALKIEGMRHDGNEPPMQKWIIARDNYPPPQAGD